VQPGGLEGRPDGGRCECERAAAAPGRAAPGGPGQGGTAAVVGCGDSGRAVTVSILFMTPTTVYEVAVTRLWQRKPAQLMQMPTTHEASSQKSAALVSSIPCSRAWLSSPAITPTSIAGSTERVFV
jgi:hypothetical protein